MPASFDNLINKFKSSTKKAADDMNKGARIVRLKMDIMTQKGEKTRLLQNVGEKAYHLYSEGHGIDGLLDRIQNEFNMVQRIDARIAEIEAEIVELSKAMQGQDIADAEVVAEVKEATEEHHCENKPGDECHM